MQNIKRILFIIFFLTIGIFQVSAQYRPPSNYKALNYTKLSVSLDYGDNLPNSWGNSETELFIKLDGKHRYGFLELYWFIDLYNTFNSGKVSDKFYTNPDYIYGKINPRLSIDYIFNTKLDFLFFKEWFISYNFEYDNKNLLLHYLGVGIDLKFPAFKYFKTNVYARYVEKNYGRNTKSWDGGMFNMSYGIILYKFTNQFTLEYEGIMDVVFAVKTDSSIYNQRSNSLQWDNKLLLKYKDISIYYTYQINNDYDELNQFSSNVNSQHVGISYSIKF